MGCAIIILTMSYHIGKEYKLEYISKVFKINGITNVIMLIRKMIENL